MRLLVIFFLFFFLSSCTKPKTVLICGDHICINKTEAEQYFEENLSIEVKIIDKKIKNEVNLVQLNLRKTDEGKKSVSVTSMPQSNKKLKTLSNKQVSEIKKKIKSKKIAKKPSLKEKKDFNQKKTTPNKSKRIQKDLVDVCTILEKCSIDEISKYLLKQGKNKSFPDITIRQ